MKLTTIALAAAAAVGVVSMPTASALVCEGECQTRDTSSAWENGMRQAKENELAAVRVAGNADEYLPLGGQFAPSSFVECVDGFAGDYPCKNIDLLSFTPLDFLSNRSFTMGAGYSYGGSRGTRETQDQLDPVCKACQRDTASPDYTEEAYEARCTEAIEAALADAGNFPCNTTEPFCSTCSDDIDSFECRNDVENKFCNPMSSGSDVWGWTDPETNKEYAIMGDFTGHTFVDVTDGRKPRVLARLEAGGIPLFWKDVKVYNNYAYMVSEAENTGLQIFDLTRLRDITEFTQVTEDFRYTGITDAHNMVINEETGRGYVVGSNTCNGGLHILDLNQQPEPEFLGCYAGDNYTHDANCVVYRGEDVNFQGKEICFAFNEDTMTVVDVTDATAAYAITKTGYGGPNATYDNPSARKVGGYTHQGWISPDHKYVSLTDELDEIRMGSGRHSYIFDVSSLTYVPNVYTYDAKNSALDHNNYFTDDGLLWQGNYANGLNVLRRFDEPTLYFKEIAAFDVYPEGDPAAFTGTWSVYPYFPSGNILISTFDRGLFVVAPQGDLVALDDEAAACDWEQLLARF